MTVAASTITTKASFVVIDLFELLTTLNGHISDCSITQTKNCKFVRYNLFSFQTSGISIQPNQFRYSPSNLLGSTQIELYFNSVMFLCRKCAASFVIMFIYS